MDNQFFKKISSYKTFESVWNNFENRILWLYSIQNVFTKEAKEQSEDPRIRNNLVNGILSLPIALLQLNLTNSYLKDIYDKLLEMIPLISSNGEKGYLFEALCLIGKMLIKKGKFQFFINGMIIVDPKKPREARDVHEYDIIELLINDRNKAECWIYACSILDDYTSRNKDPLEQLARHIHDAYPELLIRTRYMIPTNKGENNWIPLEKETGVGYWNN